MSEYPYAKVTIIFEEAEGKTTTYRIPKARNISIESKSIPVNEDLRRREFLTDTVDLEFRLTSDYDAEKQHLYSIEESRVAKTVSFE